MPLAVQWLGLSPFTAVVWVQSLLGELRFCKPHREAEKKRKSNKTLNEGYHKEVQADVSICGPGGEVQLCT